MKISRAARLALAAGLISSLAYLSALPGAFHFDDFHSIVNNPYLLYADLKTAFTRPEIFSGLKVPMFRPLTVLSFGWQARLGLDLPPHLAAVNIALHGFASAMVWLCAFALGRSEKKAFLASLFFGLHPLQSQAVNYISCRSILLAAAFGLVSFFFLIRFLERGGKIRLAVSLFFYALALLGKSSAFILFLAPLLLWAAMGKRRYSAPRLLVSFLGLSAVAGAYLLVRALVGVDVLIPSRPLRPISANLATGVRAGLYYLWLLFEPSRISVVHQIEPSVSLIDPRAGAALFCFLLILAAAWLYRKDRPLYFTGFGFYCLSLLPAHSLVPLRSVIAEHRVYLGMAGLSLAAAELFSSLLSLPEGKKTRFAVNQQKVFWQKRAAGFCLLILFSCYALLTQVRNRTWQSEMKLWRSAVSAAPASPVAWGNYGVALWEAGEVRKSRSAFMKTLSLEPGHLPSLTNLGRIYADEGKLDKAVELLQRALAKAPEEPMIHYNLAIAYQRAGKFRLAESHYLETLNRLPGHLHACMRLLGLYVYNTREFGKAENLAPRCLALHPRGDELEQIKQALRDLSHLKNQLPGSFQPEAGRKPRTKKKTTTP